MKNQNIKVAVDAVVFGYEKEQLFILLVQKKFGKSSNAWMLPGGMVQDDEGLQTAVNRELKEETGIEINYLEQLYTFGNDIYRDSRTRVISITYLALANPQKLQLKPSSKIKEAKWFNVNEMPSLAYDHSKFIKKGIERLKSKLSYQPIGFDLLDDEFPFSHLENLYKTILGKELDRRNFRKKIMSFGILEETNKKVSMGSGRPAKLFRFNKQKYRALEKEGIYFEIKYA